ARLLLVDGERLHDLRSRHVADPGLEHRVGGGTGVEPPARFAGLLREILLDPGQSLALLVAERKRLQHLLLADLTSAGLDHEDRLLGSGDDQLERRARKLLVGWVCSEAS